MPQSMQQALQIVRSYSDSIANRNRQGNADAMALAKTAMNGRLQLTAGVGKFGALPLFSTRSSTSNVCPTCWGP